MILAPTAAQPQIIIVPRTRNIQPRRLHAQYLAPRQYMRRLGPDVGRPAPAPRQAAPFPGPARPTRTITNGPAASALPAPVAPPLVAPTIDSAKERERKAAAQRSAVEFLKQRAESGSVSAQYELGKRYMTGDGVDRDLGLARKWLEASAKQGDENARGKLDELSKLENPLKK